MDAFLKDTNAVITFVSAIIALSSAIVSPVLSNWIISRNELKKQELSTQLSGFELIYPKKLAAYSEFVSELSVFVDTNGENYDRYKLLPAMNTTFLLCDEKSRAALTAFKNEFYLWDHNIMPLADAVIKELNRELLETEAKIGHSRKGNSKHRKT